MTLGRVERMTRIEGVNPEQTEPRVKAALQAGAKKWGAPLLPSLLYARRPTIFRAAGAMWSGLADSGLLDPKLVALINRRVAALNGCVF